MQRDPFQRRDGNAITTMQDVARDKKEEKKTKTITEQKCET
jgi:hypothetical protein